MASINYGLEEGTEKESLPVENTHFTVTVVLRVVASDVYDWPNKAAEYIAFDELKAQIRRVQERKTEGRNEAAASARPNAGNRSDVTHMQETFLENLKVHNYWPVIGALARHGVSVSCTVRADIQVTAFMASPCFGTILRIMAWSSSQLVLLTSAHQDRTPWAGSASLGSYIVWLACGVWLALTDLDIVARRPRLVAIPPFFLVVILVACSKAGLREAVAILPTAVNIGTVIVSEWERDRKKVSLRPVQYMF